MMGEGTRSSTFMGKGSPRSWKATVRQDRTEPSCLQTRTRKDLVVREGPYFQDHEWKSPEVPREIVLGNLIIIPLSSHRST